MSSYARSVVLANRRRTAGLVDAQVRSVDFSGSLHMATIRTAFPNVDRFCEPLYVAACMLGGVNRRHLDTVKPEWIEMKPITDVVNEALIVAGKS